jgi:ABC-2 type transport system permease protein
VNFSRVKGVFFRMVYGLVKGPYQLMDLLYWPFVDILLWGLTAVWIQQEGDVSNLPLFIMTGLIFWQIANRGSLDVSFPLLQEFWHRNLLNLFSSPLKISEWSIGIVLIGLCKLVITVAFGAIVVYIFYSLNIFQMGWAFLPFAASLYLFGLAIGFLASSAIIYWGQQIEVLAFMIAFIFAPFSAVFYPVETLPAWAQTISWCLPTTYIFEGMREVLRTNQFPLSLFCMSVVLNIAYLVGSLLIFFIMFEKSRTRGIGRVG